MTRITDREIKSLIKNHVAGVKKKISIGDSLFLVFTKAGTPTWEYAYRFDGKQRTLSIGIYPEVSLRQARAELYQARLKVSEGIDPSRQKQINKFSKNKYKKTRPLNQGRVKLPVVPPCLLTQAAHFMY